MAEGGSEYSLEFLMECCICCEDFSLEGPHVPRILPCSHTLCELCIKNILEKKSGDSNLLECPMCMVKHPVSKGALSFPQNQFILPIVRKKMNKAAKEEICVNHGRIITLFCNDPNCQINICNVCMFEEHRNHNFVDLPKLQTIRHNVMTGNIDSLKKTLKSLKEDLKSDRQRFVEKQMEINKNMNDACKQIEVQKNAKIAEVTKIITGIYDDMLKNVKTQKMAEIGRIKEDAMSMKDFCDEIENIEDRINLKSITSEMGNFKRFLDRVGVVRDTGCRYYQRVTPVVKKVECDQFKELCSTLKENPMSLNYLESFSMYRLMSACQLNDTVKRIAMPRSFGEPLGLDELRGDTLISWNEHSIFTCGLNNTKGKEFNNMRNIKYLCCLGEYFAASSCGYWRYEGLSFYDANSLEVCDRCTLERKTRYKGHIPEPGCLCRAGPSTLLILVENATERPNEVRWLDCSKLPAKPFAGRKNIQILSHNKVHAMCYVRKHNRELLVYSSDEGIFAQNVESLENEWSVVKSTYGSLKNIRAITTDGRGHIFLVDPKHSVVLMFSSDGVEIGLVMDLRDIGTPGPICWCENRLSLAVAYKQIELWNIALIELSKITKW